MYKRVVMFRWVVGKYRLYKRIVMFRWVVGKYRLYKTVVMFRWVFGQVLKEGCDVQVGGWQVQAG